MNNIPPPPPRPSPAAGFALQGRGILNRFLGKPDQATQHRMRLSVDSYTLLLAAEITTPHRYIDQKARHPEKYRAAIQPRQSCHP